jgi:hypothetical protein
MDYYAEIDVSLEASSICVVDGSGKIIKETKVLSEPEALIAWFKGLPFELERIGLEAGPLSQWLYAGLKEGVRGGVVGDAACPRRLQDNAGEDGPDRCTWHRATHAAWLVQAGALQIDACSGQPGSWCRASSSMCR